MTEQQDAEVIARTFLKEHPRCFHLLSASVVTLMVEGFILRRVIVSLSGGRPHTKFDADVLRRLGCDVFNAANRLSTAEV